MAREVLAWLDSPQRIQVVQQRFTDLHATLIRDTVGLSVGVIERCMGLHRG